MKNFWMVFLIVFLTGGFALLAYWVYKGIIYQQAYNPVYEADVVTAAKQASFFNQQLAYVNAGVGQFFSNLATVVKVGAGLV